MEVSVAINAKKGYNIIGKSDFGNLNVNYIITYKDMTTREIIIMGPLVILTVWLGFFPYYIFDVTLASVSLLLEKIKCF